MARKKVTKTDTTAPVCAVAAADAKPPVPVQAAPVDPVVYLDANLEIQRIEEAQRRFAEILTNATTTTLDVSRISAVDTSGVQLLLALLLEAPKRGLNLCLRGESAVLTKALQMLGLEGTMRAAHGHAGE